MEISTKKDAMGLLVSPTPFWSWSQSTRFPAEYLQNLQQGSVLPLNRVDESVKVYFDLSMIEAENKKLVTVTEIYFETYTYLWCFGGFGGLIQKVRSRILDTISFTRRSRPFTWS